MNKVISDVIKIGGCIISRYFIGVLLFTTNSVLLGGAVIGFGNMELDPTVNKMVLGVAWLHLYLVIPIALYVAFFTRFHNPFKKKEIKK